MLDKIFKKDRSQLEAKADQLRKEIAEMNSKRGAYQRNLTKLQDDLKNGRIDYQLECISQAELQTLENDIKSQMSIIDNFEKELSEKQDALKRLEKDVLPKYAKDEYYQKANSIIDKMIKIREQYDKAKFDFSMLIEFDKLKEELYGLDDQMRWSKFIDYNIFDIRNGRRSLGGYSTPRQISIKELIDPTFIKERIDTVYMNYYEKSSLEQYRKNFYDALYGDGYKDIETTTKEEEETEY